MDDVLNRVAHSTPDMLLSRAIMVLEKAIGKHVNTMQKDSSATTPTGDSPPLYPFEVLSDFNSKTIIAEIYDEPNVANALALMFPRSEYSDLSRLSVDELLRKARREIWEGIVSSNKDFIIELSMGMRAYSSSLSEASDICRKFIAMHDINENNWRGGAVVLRTCVDVQVARINSNGYVNILAQVCDKNTRIK